MKQVSSNQPTTAQQAIVHVAQSAGLSGLVSVLVGVVQYLSSGSIDLRTLLTVLGSGFLTALTFIYKSISSNPNLAQAALDTANEAHARIDQFAPWFAAKSKPVQAPKPIIYPLQSQAVQQPMTTGYYQPPQTGNYPSDLATVAYPAVNLNNPNASTTASVPPAMSFLQQPDRPQQRGG